MKSISLVIPNYKKDPLIKHLPTVIKACPNTEIIVVDDCSPDDTVPYLKKHFPQVKVIRNKVNQRFAENCNIGFRAAKGDIIILINSDVAPKKNFLKPLIKHFDNPKVFAVGCLEIQTVEGKKETSGKNKCQFKRGFLIHSKAKITNLTKSTANCWASGGSMACDRKKFLEIGGFDVLYKPAYWEDIDLSWRAREKHGWKILFEPKSQVFHNHETTNVSVFGNRQMLIMASRNQILFVWKNIRGKQLLEHFLWLPYHLILTTIRTQGIFLIAFFQALNHWFKSKRVRP
jgi:O-antigen biosynthesis protein